MPLLTLNNIDYSVGGPLLIEDAMLAMDLLVGAVNKEFDGQAARVTRDIKLRRLIEADVHGAKTRIADALAKGKGSAKSGVFDDATGGADGA